MTLDYNYRILQQVWEHYELLYSKLKESVEVIPDSATGCAMCLDRPSTIQRPKRRWPSLVIELYVKDDVNLQLQI